MAHRTRRPRPLRRIHPGSEAVVRWQTADPRKTMVFPVARRVGSSMSKAWEQPLEAASRRRDANIRRAPEGRAASRQIGALYARIQKKVDGWNRSPVNPARSISETSA